MSTTRDAFERHSLTHGWHQVQLKRNPDGTYVNPMVQEQWQLWDAATQPQLAPTVPADIALPLKAQRNWECYLDPSEAEPEQLAQPFVRIVDANGQTVTTAHDLFEFKPGHAEFLVAAANAMALQGNVVDLPEPDIDGYGGEGAYTADAVRKLLAQREAQLVAALQRIASLPRVVTGPAAQPLAEAIEVAQQALDGAPVPTEPFERASPVQQRKALDLARLYVNVGIGFVPMPVHNAAEFERLGDQSIARLDDLQKAAERQEGGAA